MVDYERTLQKYPSYKESFEDNARTLRNVSLGNGNYYYAGAWKSNTSSYRDATQWLTGRYATAPNYASSLNTVIQQYGLTKYDTPASGNAGGGATVSTPNTATNPVSKPAATSSVSSGSQGYTVASGILSGESLINSASQWISYVAGTIFAIILSTQDKN